MKKQEESLLPYLKRSFMGFFAAESVFASILSRGYTAAAELAYSIAIILLLKNDDDAFFFAFTFLIILSALARSGPDILLVRKGPEWLRSNNLGALKSLYLLSAKYAVSVGLTLSVLGYLVYKYFLHNDTIGHDIKPTLIFLLASVIPFTITYLASEALKGQNRIKLSQLLYGGITYTIALVLSSASFFAGIELDSTKMSIIFFVSSIVGMLVALHLLLFYSKNIFAVCARNPPEKLLKESFDLSLIRPLSIILIWMPNIILGTTGSEAEISLYTISSRLALSVSLVVFAIEGFSNPKFAGLFFDQNYAELKTLYTRMTVLCVVFAAPLILVLLTAGGYILTIIGLSASNSLGPLYFMTIAQFINAATGPIAGLLLMMRKQHFVKTVQALLITTGIAIYLFTIPKWGSIGAAAGFLIVNASMNVAFFIFGWTQLRRLTTIPNK